MKQFLLPGLLLAASAGAVNAADLSLAKHSFKGESNHVAVTKNAATPLSGLKKSVLRSLPQSPEKKTLNIKKARHFAAEAEESGVAFFESFE
ncbi:MAG: hypothetical protein K2J06_08895, partial [Muribaculaceae bacterium]|nr:hypothetical protein [Muribaculaceae bacterium]